MKSRIREVSAVVMTPLDPKEKQRKAGKKARTKGGSFERKCVKWLEGWWGDGFFKRSLNMGVKGQAFTDGGEAVLGDIATPTNCRLWVGCKNYKFGGDKYPDALLSRTLFGNQEMWKWWDEALERAAGVSRLIGGAELRPMMLVQVYNQDFFIVVSTEFLESAAQALGVSDWQLCPRWDVYRAADCSMHIFPREVFEILFPKIEAVTRFIGGELP